MLCYLLVTNSLFINRNIYQILVTHPGFVRVPFALSITTFKPSLNNYELIDIFLFSFSDTNEQHLIFIRKIKKKKKIHTSKCILTKNPEVLSSKHLNLTVKLLSKRCALSGRRTSCSVRLLTSGGRKEFHRI